MQANHIFLALNIVAAIVAMVLVVIILDIRAKRIVERDGKRRLIDREVAQKLIPINSAMEKKMEEKLSRADIKQSAYDFLLRTIINGIIAGVAAFFLSIFVFPPYVSILVTVAIMAIAIYFPIAEIDKRIKSVQLERSMQLPRYIKTLITLLKTKTTYDAIEESVKFATPAIKPFAKQLLIEINQYPNSSRPFDNFAKDLNVKQARQFMNLLYQSLDLSQKTSLEFMEKLKVMSDLLEEESAKKMSLKEVKSMEQYNMILFFCLLALPLALAGVVYMDVMKSM